MTVRENRYSGFLHHAKVHSFRLKVTSRYQVAKYADYRSALGRPAGSFSLLPGLALGRCRFRRLRGARLRYYRIFQISRRHIRLVLTNRVVGFDSFAVEAVHQLALSGL